MSTVSDKEDSLELSSDPPERTRTKLSLQDRMKVVDYLRAQVSPIIAESKSAIGDIIAKATGVAIKWDQVRYLIDELPDFKLGEKIGVIEKPTDPALAAISARIDALDASIQKHHEAIAEIFSRLKTLDAVVDTLLGPTGLSL